MTVNVNAEWWDWIQRHWPGADDKTQRLLWAMWRSAVAVGRRVEREGVEPVEGRSPC
jgi:hypothetical protein